MSNASNNNDGSENPPTNIRTPASMHTYTFNTKADIVELTNQQRSLGGKESYNISPKSSVPNLGSVRNASIAGSSRVDEAETRTANSDHTGTDTSTTAISRRMATLSLDTNMAGSRSNTSER